MWYEPRNKRPVKAVPESRRCKRGCCYTSLDVCALKYVCRCHHAPTGVTAARLRLEDFLDALGDDE
jgi:hypothetical protein